MAGKTEVFYNTYDPNAKGVEYISIQAQNARPYVYAVYNAGQRDEAIKAMGSGMVIVPIKAAKNLFEFRKGSLEDLTGGD